jgi:hypothetical protein
MYFQFLFALDRVKALAPQHPEWKTKEPFASLLKGDVKDALAGGERAMLEVVMAMNAGMTTEEFETIVKDWLAIAILTGCQTPVGVTRVDPETVRRQLTRNVLSTGETSPYTDIVLHVLDLKESYFEDPCGTLNKFVRLPDLVNPRFTHTQPAAYDNETSWVSEVIDNAAHPRTHFAANLIGMLSASFI